MLRAVLIAVALAVLAAPVAALAEIRAPSLATDPGWEGHNNVPTDPPCKQRRQQFGFDAGGRIGGLISRSLTPASFARPVRRATFGSRLSASGRFVIDGPPYGGTLQLGWFNHASRGWRMPNSLLVRVIGPLGPKRPGQVWVSYGTVLGSGGGRLYTPGGRPLPVKLGRTYRWRVTFDRGTVSLAIGHKHALRFRLPGPHRQAGAVIDRFGLVNQNGDGPAIVGHVDGLRGDGRAVLDGRSAWEGSGNQVSFVDCAVHNRHAFGWQPPAGGGAGTVGGLIWRIAPSKPEAPAWYADRVGPLSLNDELCASGTMRADITGADSNSLFGWFASAARGKPYPEGFLGIGVDASTRAGTRIGAGFRTATKPVHRPAENAWANVPPGTGPHPWTLHYVPSGNGGQVALTVDGQALPPAVVPPAARAAGVTFDRFGMRSVDSQGQGQSVSWGNLRYTATAGPGCASVV